MEKLIISETDSTPKVVLDKENSKFEIAGVSLPENVFEFYTPVIKWIKEYSKQPNPKTEFHVNLSYFNTASSKTVLDILSIFEDLHTKGLETEIVWYFLEMDEDMQATGKEFESMLKVPFRYIAYV
jgi:hypothetical protein